MTARPRLHKVTKVDASGRTTAFVRVHATWWPPKKPYPYSSTRQDRRQRRRAAKASFREMLGAS